jgi:hypothetical protein
VAVLIIGADLGWGHESQPHESIDICGANAIPELMVNELGERIPIRT